MRYIAWVAEPELDAKELKAVGNYWETIGVMFNFATLCVNPNGPGDFKRWRDLEAAHPDAKYIFPTADDGTPVDEFVPPEGKTIYVVGGDYSASNNYQGDYDQAVTVETALKPGVGAWSFLAMSVIAHRVYTKC